MLEIPVEPLPLQIPVEAIPLERIVEVFNWTSVERQRIAAGIAELTTSHLAACELTACELTAVHCKYL